MGLLLLVRAADKLSLMKFGCGDYVFFPLILVADYTGVSASDCQYYIDKLFFYGLARWSGFVRSESVQLLRVVQIWPILNLPPMVRHRRRPEPITDPTLWGVELCMSLCQFMIASSR